MEKQDKPLFQRSQSTKAIIDRHKIGHCEPQSDTLVEAWNDSPERSFLPSKDDSPLKGDDHSERGFGDTPSSTRSRPRPALSDTSINVGAIQGEVRFGLDGGKVRYPGHDVSQEKRVQKVMKPRVRRLEYPQGYDENQQMMMGVVEMVLPGSLGTQPGNGSKLEQKKVAQKAWENSHRYDWIGGLR